MAKYVSARASTIHSPARDFLTNLFPGAYFISIEEAARVTGFSPKSIYHLAARNEAPFPTVKMGRRRLVPLLSLADLLDAATTGADPRALRCGSRRGGRSRLPAEEGLGSPVSVAHGINKG